MEKDVESISKDHQVNTRKIEECNQQSALYEKEREDVEKAVSIYFHSTNFNQTIGAENKIDKFKKTINDIRSQISNKQKRLKVLQQETDDLRSQHQAISDMVKEQQNKRSTLERTLNQKKLLIDNNTSSIRNW